MRELPILFSGAMVRALLNGTKTQTRRVVKRVGPAHAQAISFASGAWQYADNDGWHDANAPRCPYGEPGDRLWVRETFAKIDGQTQPWIETDYRATYTHGDRLGDTLGIKKRWTPAIHMPRAASRITLEVTCVRVEQLQDISETDAKAEGVSASPTCLQDDDTDAFRRIGPVPDNSFPIARYAALWESINGPGSWAANPFIWCVSFRRVEP